STLAAVTAERDQVKAERDKLRRAYEQLKEHLELLRRRIFVAKAERIDVTQLQMEFAETQAKLDALAKQIEDAPTTSAAIEIAADDGAPFPPAKPRPKPTGR